MHTFEKSPQAAMVLRELVRYIDRLGLLPGDTLPSQSDIREMFGFHNTTLDAAMRALVANGIVNRRKKSGTVLLRKDYAVRGLWRVGLVLLSAKTLTEPFYSQLLHHIQSSLHEEQHFIRQYMVESGNTNKVTSISKFPHLVDDLTEGALDALLTLSYLPENQWMCWNKKTPLVHVGSWENAPCGAIIEQGQMVREAVSNLVSRGSRNLAIVSIGGYRFHEPRFWSTFVQATSEHGLYFGPQQHISRGNGAEAGAIIANEILERPIKYRPDALIVINDSIASGITATLVRQSEYRPIIVAQTNKQAPLAFSFPVIQYQLDISELADKAVKLLIARLYNPDLPPEVKWVYPRFSGEGQFS